MRKNNIILILLVGLTLVFGGCSVSTTGAKQNSFGIGSGSSSNSNSNSGSGVDLTFGNNNPPAQMIEGAPSTFAFIFTNHQNQDITDLKLKTKGFDSSYVTGLAQEYNVGTIPKATSQGGPGIYSGLIVSGVKVSGFTGNFNFNPTFEYCYGAQTNYREAICVPSTQNQCNVKVSNSVESNGPVSVNVDRINSIGNQIRIDFSISNSGNGHVVNTCFKTQDYSNAYKLVDVKLGTNSGNCKAISGYKLNNGKSTFYCTFPRTSSDSYASQVTVDLSYLYDQQVQKQISVQDLNANN